MIARTYYFTTRLEIRNESDPGLSEPSGIALKSFQCTKLLGSRTRALRVESAAAPWRSQVNWRRRPTALRRPPRLAPHRNTHTDAPHTHAAASQHSRTTRTPAHTQSKTDKQHKNTTLLCNCTFKHTTFSCFCVFDTGPLISNRNHNNIKPEEKSLAGD